MTIGSDVPSSMPPSPDGDWRRFEELHQEHYRQILAYVARRVEPFSAAEDVVSETFLVAWRRFADVPEYRADTWLLATARRVLANQRRGEARRRQLVVKLGEQRDDVVRTPAEELEETERLHALDIALHSLSDVDRDVLLMATWEHLPHAKIAQVVDVAIPTVAVRLHRARKRLADEYVKALGDTGHPYDEGPESSGAQR